MTDYPPPGAPPPAPSAAPPGSPAPSRWGVATPPPPGWPPAPARWVRPTGPGRCRCDRWAWPTCTTRAFRIMRFNPQATVGAAACWWRRQPGHPRRGHRTPAGLSATARTAPPDRVGGTVGEVDVSLIAASTARSVAGAVVLQGLGTMPAHRDDRARHPGRGCRPQAGAREAWAGTHGKRWRLIGLALVAGLLVVPPCVPGLGLAIVLVDRWPPPGSRSAGASRSSPRSSGSGSGSTTCPCRR